MSIGKFFILAILLPMATIYLTLTLKGERHEIIELENELEDVVEIEDLELERLNSENFKMVFEKSESSLNDQAIIKQDNKLKPKNKISTKTAIKNPETKTSSISKSTIFSLEQSSQSGQLFTSIEAMIKFKKNKGKETVQTKNYNSIFNDDNDVKRTTKKQITSKTRAKVKKSTKVTPPRKSSVLSDPEKINKSNPKKLAKIAKPVKIKKLSTTKIIRQPIKVSKKIKQVKVNKPIRKQRLSNEQVTQTAKISNPENLQKRRFFNKQDSSKKRKLDKKTQEILSRLQENNFGDVFDDDGEPDIDLSDLNQTTTDSVESSNTKAETENAKKDQFTSNPCSGGSARYIARCRK